MSARGRRIGLAAVLAILAAAPAAGLAGSAGGAPADARAAGARTTAVGVGLREYRVALYRSRVRAGRVRFNMENFGEDPHDLQVSGPGRSQTVRGTSREVGAGGRGRLTVTLRRPGVYRVICTIGDHAELGMVARMRVVRGR